MTKKEAVNGFLKSSIVRHELILGVRHNASKYELKQAAIRENAMEWQIRTANKRLSYAELLHDTRIFEKYAKKYGLQRE